MFNYWETEGGKAELLGIMKNQMGQIVTDHLDILSRNAFLTNPYSLIGNGSGTDFGDITSTSKISTEIIDSIWLGMRDRSMPFASMPNPYPTGNEIICITTAGVVHDLKREVGAGGALAFVDASKYQGGTNLMRGELGMWRGVRFIDNGMAKLRNVGTATVQTTVVAPVLPGDGAPGSAELVEEVRYVGQPDAAHYIEVTSAVGLSAGDIVTVHKTRHAGTNIRGVLNGVDYTDPMAQDLEIHSVDTVSVPNRITFKEPYMMISGNGKGLETDLGSGVYGYVTLGQTVHTALFLNPAAVNSPGAAPLVCGVAQPPVVYTPPPNDDYMSIYRISYDFWMKYALWEPRVFEIWFGAGANKGQGAVYY